MPERPPRQLVLLVAVGDERAASAILDAAGVAPPPPADRARLDAAARALPGLDTSSSAAPPHESAAGGTAALRHEGAPASAGLRHEGAPSSAAPPHESAAGGTDAQAGALATLRSMAVAGGSAPIGWGGRHLAASLARWCDLAADAGWDAMAVLAWQDPAAVAAAAGPGAGAAEALAAWEADGRAALAGLAGRRCVVVPAGSGGVDLAAAAVVARAVGLPPPELGTAPPDPGTAAPDLGAAAPDLGMAPPDLGTAAPELGTAAPSAAGAAAASAPAVGAPATGDGTPGPGTATAATVSAGGDRCRPADAVLPAHRRLAELLAGLTGAHQALDPPEVPPASSWALALARAGDAARQAKAEARQAWAHAWERAEDADALWQALWRVGDELADAVAADLPVQHMPPYGGDATVDLHGYLRWIREREPAPGPPGSAATADPRLGRGPLVSVVVPVYKPEPSLLESAVASVLRQTYDHWELCLCDDGSGDPAVTAVLQELAGRDPRIRVTALARNGGISAATNGALAIATGEWVAFMDQDDELAPDALAAVVAAVLDDDTVDLVYTDDDKIDREGRRFGPQFKPDWDPDLLLSMCYFSHLVAMRRSLVDEVGGLRSAYDGGQDWDLNLRVAERSRTVHHIPRVLYHWRAVPGSAALDASYKPWAYEAARRAVADALARRKEPGSVEHHPRFRGLYHVRRSRTGNPLVSIVVPFRDDAALLQRCVDSLVVDPGHERFELLLVDNGSTEPEMAALLDRLSADERVTVLSDPRPFNWAALNNGAIDRSRGDMVLTLNNDVTAASPGWLHELVVHGQRPDIGAVGARLLYPDGRVQHVGAVVGLGGIVAHPMRGLPGDHPGYMGFGTVIRGWSAVTGACMLVRRSVVEEVGGFDEDLAVAFNDVDFCLRVGQRGYRIVCTPLAELVHAESSTRGFTGYARDIVPFVTRWEHWLRGEDPMFSPNLSRFDARCVVRLADEDALWNRQLHKLGLS